MKDMLLPLKLIKRKMVHWRYEFVCKHCSVETASKVRYEMLMHKKLNLENPITLNEKLQWLKLNTYRDNDLVTQCCDKYKVREYVKLSGGGGLFSRIIWSL